MSQLKQKKNDDFFSKVYEVTKCIPYGRITSYGAIARYLGTGRSARMVGWALNVSHSNQEFIPAHRVVNRSGLLTGKHHFGNSTTMKQLLENEGIIIENDRIINFEENFWDPGKELK
jgi:methylated-DNA-protein-cysteine methyltransferase-like protein